MMIPKSHPRYLSLKTRDLIVNGIKKGVTSIHGLIAHGRGEAFDYLLGEKTNQFAEKSIEAAATLLLMAEYPVISVNGNSAVLVPKDLVKLSTLISAPLEVNIFHPDENQRFSGHRKSKGFSRASKQREIKIKKYLEKYRAKNVLLPQKNTKIKYLESNRKYVNPNGILKADVVFVPLEDGDRTEALIKNGKRVITIDLNPLSRTAQKATITIVDNIIRAMPLLIMAIKQYKKYDENKLQQILKNYNNKSNLKNSSKYMLQNLS